MNTFILIIKILPWGLSLVGVAIAYLKNKKAKELYKEVEFKTGTIVKLKEIIVTQGEELENKSKQITELLRISKKYEDKKTEVKNSKKATESMASNRN